jgi:hypothetical protein
VLLLVCENALTNSTHRRHTQELGNYTIVNPKFNHIRDADSTINANFVTHCESLNTPKTGVSTNCRMNVIEITNRRLVRRPSSLVAMTECNLDNNSSMSLISASKSRHRLDNLSCPPIKA